jgi:diguanylate cyclase (GGDEF)-like protein/PAS domain S-box-containing protein
MTVCGELMESVLEAYPEAIALISEDGQVRLWNRAAEEISGYPAIEVVARRIPSGLEALLFPAEVQEGQTGTHRERSVSIHLQHRQGYELQVAARAKVLRNGLGERIGHAVIFRKGEGRDALPRGQTAQCLEIDSSQEEFEQRLDDAFNDFVQRGECMGVLWITVDQAETLRKTHGSRACEAMLDSVERTLSNGLHAADEVGRWGDDEFLVLAHEPTAARLAAHAQVLAGLARTSVFRWWGDRISLTVSVGAAQAEREEALVGLMERAQAAMTASVHAGGNHITLAPGRHSCSQS